MQDHEDERSRHYGPRGERSAGFSSSTRERDWKGRRESRPDRRDEPPVREGERGRGRGSGQSRPQVEDMDVFRLAHDLAVRTHQLTSRFPAEERGSLVALLRRASAAVPAQLAAGSSRWHRIEYRGAVTSARDAAAETRYFLLLVKDLGHLSVQDCDDMRDGYERVAKMLSRLAHALQEGSR